MKLKEATRAFLLFFSSISLLPHILLMYRGPNRLVIRQDIERWSKIILDEHNQGTKSVLYSFVWLMTFHPEFRSLFYYRLGWLGKIMGASPFHKPMPTLYIATRNIGPGLFIQHGFSTIIAAEKIGRNCWINQQTTIGYSEIDECPTLEDNVKVCAGAKVLGAITVGSNSTVGANAVVIKNVPPNCTVVGVPAYIVRRDGERTKEALQEA